MEIIENPILSLSLRQEPKILAVGAAMVGTRKVEEYTPYAYWQLGFFEGKTVVELSKAEKMWRLEINPHDIFIIPPGTVRKYFSEHPLRHYYLSFQFPVESPPTECVQLPALISTGPNAEMMQRDFAAVIDLGETDPVESEMLARLLIWRLVRLARLSDKAQQGGEYAVQASLQRIRESIGNPDLTPETLADKVGLSRRRLDQLFMRIVGKPVFACIRDRRVQLAEDLLRQTALPIHTIGTQVGIPDSHAFNKFIRRNCGKSPSALRTAD
jgi:AraC-like DNA-binding protein